MIKQDIYTALTRLPNVVVQSSTQLRTKCFLCGDSKKNPYKKRLGIKIDLRDTQSPIVFNCFNCGAHGIFTVDMLHQMNIFDKDMDIGLRQLNRGALSNDGTRVNKYKNTKEISVKIPPLYNNPKTVRKIKYLYNRLDYKIPVEDFSKLKIVFNIRDFLDMNNIPPVNNHISELDADYMGFLSVMNEYLILRDITDSHHMRWVKYNIFNILDNTQSFYTINNSIQLLTEEDIHIDVTEGPMDILGVMYNILGGDTTNHICISTCNGSFMEPIKFFLRKGLVGGNIHINCYQDNDTMLNWSIIKNQLKPYVMKGQNFNVYYNTLSKDFGVPLSQTIVDRLIVE